MCAFSHERSKIPEGIVSRLSLGKAAIRFLFRCVDQVCKFDRVLDEEHRYVVPDKIPIAFWRVKLHCKSAHVARKIARPRIAGHCREANKDWCLLSHTIEDTCLG